MTRTHERVRMAWIKLPHLAHRTTRTLDLSWDEVDVDRVAIVATLVTRSKNGRYLEIGCEDDACFEKIDAAHKVGVDPVAGGTHRMTSDAFFAVNNERFDVVFIDGDHTYEQARRDLVNALARVDVGGYIVLHDVIPRTWLEEHVPRLQVEWTGDVWKVAIDLAAAEGVTMQVVLVDYGVAVVRKDVASPSIPRVLGPAADQLRFRAFLRRFVALKTVSHVDWCQSLTAPNDRRRDAEGIPA